ncbi:aa3-type cytochrome c oxidase subunit IV [Actibacterium sp. XHP0104]|nr:aa3-type cytochrome c oxidase subunit IV [Actibacterium sp. XHP0104]MCV2883033.1 aa3-type cytochrome c oxidase subunit IV [Actibacterium sp. XHP0104]
MAQHKHGSMDTAEQEKTFEGFVKFSAVVAVLSILVIIFMGLANS